MNQFIKKLYINCSQPLKKRLSKCDMREKKINIFTQQKSTLGDLGAGEK
jgi:hypothetical protein